MQQHLSIVLEEIHTGIMFDGPLDILYLPNIYPVNSIPSAQNVFVPKPLILICELILRPIWFLL